MKDKEYELIHEQQFGVHYRRWVRVVCRALYLGNDVFLYRPFPSYSVITHTATGQSIANGKISPYPSAVVDYLNRVLTPEQKDRLRQYSGRLVQAGLYSQLCGLPVFRKAKPAIQVKRRESWRLEGIITGQELPW